MNNYNMSYTFNSGGKFNVHSLQPQHHFSNLQMQNKLKTVQKSRKNKFKRTAITIDSRNRNQSFKPLLANEIVSIKNRNLIECKCILDSVHESSYTLKFEYKFDKEISLTDDEIYVRNYNGSVKVITHTIPSELLAKQIPLHHFVFDDATGLQLHNINLKMKDNDNKTIELKLTILNYKWWEENDEFKTTPITIKKVNIPIFYRLVSIEKGWSNPNEYKISLNRNYTNVVSVRLLNSVIPNTAYLIDSNRLKNNKLCWVNKQSRYLITKTDFETISDKENICVTLLDDDDEKYDTHYQIFYIHSLTLSEGDYKIQNLASELENQMNYPKEKSLNFTFFDENTMSFEYKRRYHGPRNAEGTIFDDDIELISDSGLNNDTITSNSRFKIYLDDSKKYISFRQYENIYRNVENKTDLPFIINEGYPWLYVKLYGTDLQSGDMVYIQGMHNICNINAHDEINGEHYVYVSKRIVILQTNNIEAVIGGQYDMSLFKKYDIVYRAQINNTSSCIAYARIVDIVYELTEEEGSGGITGIKLELLSEDYINNDVGEDFIYRTNNSELQFIVTGDLVQEISTISFGYSIKLNSIPNRSFLEGVGNVKLFIGKTIDFSILFGIDNSPNKVLGFKNNTNGNKMNETLFEKINFNKSIENTIIKNELEIHSSKIIGVSDNYISVQIQCYEMVPFVKGDRIFIKGHLLSYNDVNGDRHILNNYNGHLVYTSEHSTFTVRISKKYCNFYQKIEHTTNLDIIIGGFGKVYKKEIDQPYVLQDHYLYLVCPTLNTTLQTQYSSSSLDNIFSQIYLPGTSGEYLFNTHTSYPKIFDNFPLRSLHELYFKFINADNELYDFNKMEHSLVLEIVELNDRLDYLNVSSGTVQN